MQVWQLKKGFFAETDIFLAKLVGWSHRLNPFDCHLTMEHSAVKYDLNFTVLYTHRALFWRIYENV